MEYANNCVGVTCNSHRGIIKIWSLPYTIYKISFRWIQDINIIGKTYKYLKHNVQGSHIQLRPKTHTWIAGWILSWLECVWEETNSCIFLTLISTPPPPSSSGFLRSFPSLSSTLLKNWMEKNMLCWKNTRVCKGGQL